MHDRIAKGKIIQAYIIGAVGGAILMLILCANKTEAHSPCNDDVQCRTVIAIDEDTGEEKTYHVCR